VLRATVPAVLAAAYSFPLDTDRMKQLPFFARAAAAIAMLAPLGVTAADCPQNLDRVGRVTMTDAKGLVTVLEALDSGYVRRIEELADSKPPSKTHIEAFQGFFAETITTIGPATTFAQYYKISAESYARLRAALPPKPGTTFALDYEVIYTNSGTLGAAPPPPVPPPVPANRQWKVNYTIKGEDTVKIGDCNYPVRLVESKSSNADNSFATETSIAYSPDLKAWLKLKGVFKPADKPESTIDRTIVSIGTAARN
jgi:hypothetical protein